jgi:uncharacterized protein
VCGDIPFLLDTLSLKDISCSRKSLWEESMEQATFCPESQLKQVWHFINFVIMFFIILSFVILMLATNTFWVLAIGLLFTIIVDAFYIWYISAFYRSLEYQIAPEGLKAKKGVFWRKKTSVPYRKITNIDISQGPLERFYGLSKVHIQTAGSSGAEHSQAELVFHGIRDSEDLKDSILAYIDYPKPKPTPAPAVPTDEAEILQAILKEVTKISTRLG